MALGMIMPLLHYNIISIDKLDDVYNIKLSISLIWPNVFQY